MKLQSKKTEPKHRSVAIIGRGIAGLSLALELQERGFQVSIVGLAEDEGCASNAAIGLSSLKGIYHARKPLFAAKIKGAKALPAYINRVEKIGKSPISRNFSGSYEFFESEEHYQHLRERIYHGHFTGGHNFDVLSRTNLSELGLALPASLAKVNKLPYGCFHFKNDGFFNPKDFLKSMTSALKLLGVGFIERKVQRILLDKGRQLIFEKSGDESLIFDEIVLAAGEGSTRLLDHLVEGLPFLKTAGQTLSLKQDRQRAESYIIGKRGLVYDGYHIRYGSTDHPRNIKTDDYLLKNKHIELRNDFSNLTGLKLVNEQAKMSWGIRLAMKDRLPLVGSLQKKSKRLWVFTGFHKSGFTLCEHAAQDLAKQMLSSEIDDKHPFSPSRFGYRLC